MRPQSYRLESCSSFRCLPTMIVPSILSCLCLAAALRNQERPEALLEEPLTPAAASKRLQELRDMGPIDAALAYDWPEILEANFAEGFELFRALAESEDWIVRQGVAQSTAWTALLKQSPAEGMAMSRMLVEDEEWHVRRAAAEYLAWPALLKQNFNEGLALVHKLVEDKHFSVRARAAKYFPWPTSWKAWPCSASWLQTTTRLSKTQQLEKKNKRCKTIGSPSAFKTLDRRS